ncbi:Tim44-like domain-containing protein [Noviherbaspirillum sp. CPCC 100848]|uniref:Tim44-like domain-containing protein n=1 Tax=Noviherbaspirillum album TaxID=3080276 RepID=A0ABU6JB97_9BURK|nr:Tim44-like domain-containing protein [Noviherbaspirillum sp. CPCC 100848]MEC4720537.1 Tim44-like domain-containing protein [Noviherbaspirillum sp. CPCC 100848]
MKKFLATVMVAVSALSIGVMSEAEAKRLGSGGSVGKQSSQPYSRQSTTPAQNQAAPAASQAAPAAGAAGATGAAAAAKASSPWKGILGGALLGLGLGALLSHFGLGGALASAISTMLMIALLAGAAFFIYRMLTRNKRNGTAQASGMQPAYAASGTTSARVGTPEIGSRIEPVQPAALQSPMSSASAAAVNDAPQGSIPADFDTAGFLRHAKTYFIRLQAAWDKGDANDLREFTSPEMYAELKMQLQERGASANHTDVVSLNGELLGIETVGSDYLASVKFSGMIREADNAPAEPFTEIWNLSKPAAGEGGWVLAGIQQVA